MVYYLSAYSKYANKLHKLEGQHNKDTFTKTHARFQLGLVAGLAFPFPCY